MYKTEEDKVLSPKELEALRYLHMGLSNPEIAEKMCITVSTVKVHVSKILYKLGARNRVDVLLMLVGQKEIKNLQVKEQLKCEFETFQNVNLNEKSFDPARMFL